jgi:hypothetical protein
MNNRFIKIFTLIGFVQMLVVNSLANLLPINGLSTGELSDQLPNLFTPQGATFAIWGLIYSLLLIFTIGVLVRPLDSVMEKTARLFIINSFLNSTWIFAWHYQYLLISLMVMIGLLINLIQISILLKNTSGIVKKVVLQLPFTVYFGWITVATIANVTALLVGYDWGRLGISQENWTIAILIVGIMISLSQIIYFERIAYGVVIIWAYWGIYGKHTSEYGFDNQYPNIITVVVICLGIVILASTGLLVSRMSKRIVPE